jgi:hypothetical protein
MWRPLMILYKLGVIVDQYDGSSELLDVLWNFCMLVFSNICEMVHSIDENIHLWFYKLELTVVQCVSKSELFSCF